MVLTLIPLTAFAAETTTVYVSSSGSDSGTGTAQSPFATVKKAYDSISGSGTICLLSDLTQNAAAELNADKTVTITSAKNGNGGICSITLNARVVMFKVTGGTVTFENITLDGGGDTITAENNEQNHGIYVAGGTVNLGSGATVNNFKSNKGSKSPIRVESGVLSIDAGAEIKSNATYRPTVYVTGGTVTLNGGIISGNTSYDVGGIYVSDGTLNLICGTVTGNAGTRNTDFGVGGIWVQGASVVLNVGSETVTPSQPLIIAGNTGHEITTERTLNLALDRNKSTPPLNIKGSLAAGSSVGVSTNPVNNKTGGEKFENDVKFATGADSSTAANFFSDEQEYAGVLFKDGTLWLSSSAAGRSVNLGELPAGVTSEGGSLSQTGVGTSTKSFTAVVLKAKDGYVPLTETQAESLGAALSGSGLTAAWDSGTATVTVSGTPTKDVGLSLSDYISTEAEKIEWKTATDSGNYKSGDETLGMIRFMFVFGEGKEDSNVTKCGIKYVKNYSNGDFEITDSNATVSADEAYTAFQGDIVGIEKNSADSYSAAAYAVRYGITYWSPVVKGEVDWETTFTNYAPQNAGSN